MTDYTSTKHYKKNVFEEFSFEEHLTISVSNRGLNSLVKRVNKTVRDKEKCNAWYEYKRIGTKIIEAIRIYHNFCKEHKTLGKTPAEEAGINIGLEGNKIEYLIKLATIKKDK